jgi:hypothetical protein
MRVSPEILPPGEGEVSLVACPEPFKVGRVFGAVPAGLSLAEMLTCVQPDPVLRMHAHIWLGDDEIEPALWERVRPKPGTRVTIRCLPSGGGGGGGKNPLRTILTLAVVAAAAFAGPALGMALFGAEMTTILGIQVATATIGSALIGGVGFLIANAIAPPARPKMRALSSGAGGISERDSPTLSIEGVRNRANLFGVVPRVLGKHRMTPPFGALPYTEIVGDDQYLRFVVVWGYGPLSITDLRIGETPLSEFEGVETETVQGNPSDPPLTFFPDDVFEDSLSTKLDTGWTTRTSQPDADEISVDVTFPQGLVQYTREGDKQSNSVTVEVEWSPAGQSTWTSAGTIAVTAKTISAVRRGLRWMTNARAQYDVRLRRTTPDGSSTRTFEEVDWTALRTIRNEDPIKMTGLAKTAVRIKATEQMKGVVDTFNGIVESIIQDWDSATQTWVERATSNPASLYREVLQGAANARPLGDSRIDLANLQDWHEKCASAGCEFNMVIDFASTVIETLADIAAAGRAARAIRDGKWGVVIDELQSVPVQHFTPRNSWGFQGEKPFVDLPHAWRVRFANREKEWRQDERIVYDDGYDVTTATKFEALDLPGITDPDQVWKDGRFHIAVARLRPETYTFFTDIENIVCTKGDLVRVTHDVPLWGLGSGRVKSVQDDGAGNATGVTVDEAFAMEAGKSYTARFRKSDGSSLLANLVTTLGEQTALTFATPIPLSSAPAAGDLVMFGEAGSESVELIVRGIESGSGLTARIVCVDAAPAVHQADTGTIPPFDSQVTLPPGTGAPAVLNIRSDEEVLLFLPGGGFAPRVRIALFDASTRDRKITGIEARYREIGLDGPYRFETVPGDATEISLLDVEEGEALDIQLRYLTERGPEPWGAVIQHTVVGASNPPPDIDTLAVEGNALVWAYDSPPRDFAGFHVRHRAGTSRVWEDATPAHQGLVTENRFDLSVLPPGTRAVLVKAVDLAGNESANAAVVVKDLGDPIVANLLFTDDRKAKGFPDTIQNGSVVGGDLVANDSGSTFWGGDDNGLFWDTNASALFWNANYQAMTYTALFVPDISLLPAEISLEATVAGDPWTIEYRDGGAEPFWNVSGSATFWGVDTASFWPIESAFRAWPGKVDARRERYKFRITTGPGTVQGRITALKVQIDVPDIVEHLADVAIVSGGTRLPVTKSYRKIVNVQLTLQDDGGSAVRAEVKDKDASLGPLIAAYDGSGSGASATLDATVQGY